MWTVEWRLNDMRQLNENKENSPRAWRDAQQRVSQANILTNLSARSGPYYTEIETTYKITKIKASNYLMRSGDT